MFWPKLSNIFYEKCPGYWISLLLCLQWCHIIWIGEMVSKDTTKSNSLETQFKFCFVFTLMCYTFMISMFSPSWLRRVPYIDQEGEIKVWPQTEYFLSLINAKAHCWQIIIKLTPTSRWHQEGAPSMGGLLLLPSANFVLYMHSMMLTHSILACQLNYIWKENC